MKKNHILTFSSIIVIFSILFGLTPIFASNTLNNNQGNIATDLQVSDISDNSLSQSTLDIIELIESRNANTKIFSLPNGQFKAVVYNNAVHRQDNDGKWIDIDNRLFSSIDNGKEFYKTNDDRVVFNSSISNTQQDLFSIKENGYMIALSLDESNIKVSSATVGNHRMNTQPSKDDSFDTKLQKLTKIDNKTSIVYKNAFNNVDLEYQLVSDKVKENIIVNSTSDKYEYSFTLKLKNLYASKTSDGEIAIFDKKTHIQMYEIPAPYMVDAKGEISYDVFYTLKEIANDTYSLVIQASSLWINNVERGLPVTIDPTIGRASSTFDTHISMYEPDTNFGNSTLLRLSGSEISFVKMVLPSLPSGATITSASFNAYVPVPSSNAWIVANAYQVLSSWSENTLTWNIANQSSNLGISTTSLSSAYLFNNTTSTTNLVSFNITSAVSSWYNGTTNNGIAIKYYDGSLLDTNLYSTESSEEYDPYFEINYIPPIADGVYAFSNVGNSGLWMDTELDKSDPGYHIQQYAYSSSPTNSFSRGGLFKVSRVSGTDRYIIRSMLNNRLSFGLSGTEVVTKEIATNDSNVSIYDTFVLEYAGASGAYVIRPYGTDYVIGANNTTASGSSGAPDSYLTRYDYSDPPHELTARAKWQIVHYTGSTEYDITIEHPDTIYLLEETPVSIKTWSTVINANAPYIEVATGTPTNVATGTWNSSSNIFMLNAKNKETLVLTLQIRNGSTVIHTENQYIQSNCFINELFYTIPYVTVGEEDVNWCMPTAVANIASFWQANLGLDFGCGSNDSVKAQATEANRLMKDPLQITSINQAFAIFTATQGNKTYELEYTQYDYGYLDWQMMESELKAGRPFLLVYEDILGAPYADGDGAGHMVVCAGYTINYGVKYLLLYDGMVTYRISHQFDETLTQYRHLLTVRVAEQ